jgi:hypothetical protein
MSRLVAWLVLVAVSTIAYLLVRHMATFAVVLLYSRGPQPQQLLLPWTYRIFLHWPSVVFLPSLAGLLLLRIQRWRNQTVSFVLLAIACAWVSFLFALSVFPFWDSQSVFSPSPNHSGVPNDYFLGQKR